MKLVHSYLIQVIVIPSKSQEIIEAVKKVSDFKYGKYSWVYWQSEAGTEHFDDEQNPTVKLEFSIYKSYELLTEVLESIISVHPWREPVIRVTEVQETRTGK